MATNALLDDENKIGGGGSKPKPRPSPSFAQQAGSFVRGVATMAGATSPVNAMATTNNAIRSAIKPSVQDFAYGVSNPTSTVARPAMNASPAAAMSPVGSASAAPGAPGSAATPDFSDVRSGASTVAAKPFDIGANGERSYSNASLTRAGLLGAQGGATAAAPGASRPQPVIAAPDNPTRYAAPRMQGAVIGNPGGAAGGVYGGEAERVLKNSVDLLMANPGRTRGARALTERAIDNLYGRANAQQGAENQSALAGQNANAAADLQQQENVAKANEGFAERRLTVDLQGRELASQERIARRPQITTTAGGGLGMIGDDASFTPVTGADGQQVLGARQKADGALTESDLLKSYTDRRVAIENGLGDQAEKTNALAQLDGDPLYAGLRGNVAPGATAAGQGSAPPSGAIAALQGDPSKAGEFDAKFGPGASTRYLR